MNGSAQAGFATPSPIEPGPAETWEPGPAKPEPAKPPPVSSDPAGHRSPGPEASGPEPPESEPSASETATPGAQPKLLPPLELEVMKVLWAEGESTVAEVQASLYGFKPLAYTTVMTLLDRLARKGAVTRRKQGRGFRYTPVFTREAMTALAVDRLAEDFFSNSREELAAYLHGNPAASEKLIAREGPPDSIDSVLL